MTAWLCCWCKCFFFCNVPATTVIYTYLHTLSRHDALPICQFQAFWCAGADQNGVAAGVGDDVDLLGLVAGAAGGLQQLLRQRRSEEHTSELQSLLRISYAGFCLKKKTTFTPCTKVTADL